MIIDDWFDFIWSWSFPASRVFLQRHRCAAGMCKSEQIRRSRTGRRTATGYWWISKRLSTQLCQRYCSVNSDYFIAISVFLLKTDIHSCKKCHNHIFLFFLKISTTNRCAKQIDSLIDALPTEDNTLDMQTKSFQRLEMENQDAAELLQEVSCVIRIIIDEFDDTKGWSVKNQPKYQ